jgi:hypothetical protein
VFRESKTETIPCAKIPPINLSCGMLEVGVAWHCDFLGGWELESRGPASSLLTLLTGVEIRFS